MPIWSALLLQTVAMVAEPVAWSAREDRGTCLASPSTSASQTLVLANTPWSRKLSVVIGVAERLPPEPKVRVLALPGDRPVNATARTNTLADGNKLLIVDAFVTSDWADATAIDVRVGKRRIATVSNLPGAMAQLSTCGDGILRRYDLDPARNRPSKEISGLQGAQISTLFGFYAYPPAALKLGQKGSVTVLLRVAASGKITKCETVISSGGRELDDGTCKILVNEARLSAATDGRDGWTSVKITWVHSSIP